MNRCRFTDFSIDHILSSDFPRSACPPEDQKSPAYPPPPGEAYLHRVPWGLCYADPRRGPSGGPLVLCVPGGVGCFGPDPVASSFFSYGALRPDHLYPSDLTCYPPPQAREPGPAAGPAGRPVHRSRTVFTAGQTQQLERVFRLTDYPAGDTRAALAARSGLTEESVRVWFKNRRARRKRQKSRPADQTPPRGAPGPPQRRDPPLSALL